MMKNTALSWITDTTHGHLEGLMTWLAFPSVSTNADYTSAIEACAAYTQSLLLDAGFSDVTRIETPGHPIVYAAWQVDPALPTVLIYGHYDVQPPEPLALWETPPFVPTIREGQLFARGASDDKGQIYCHIRAIKAYAETVGKPPVNIKILIEGEEEIGSPNLQPFIIANRERLKADIALVSDTPMIAPDRPSLCTSLRGLLYTEITLRVAATDLHSGQHGGAVPNALLELSRLVTSFKNAQGEVQISGFYDGVPVLSSEERAAIRSLPHEDAAYQSELGLSHLEGEVGYHTFERRWYRPTLEINGMWGGYTGPGSKTVIAAEASAKVSMRLVGTQDPTVIAQNFTAFVHAHVTPGVHVHVDIHSMATPVQVAQDDPFVRAASVALAKAFGVASVFQGEGGTVPVVADFKRILGINTVLMGLNLPNDGIHAPNERISLANLERGMQASVHFFAEVAAL
jgi:acetylornithine deacetylase/succinyl-diaminopimelate desuccinylase-like protein